jgi:hypothetical protein
LLGIAITHDEWESMGEFKGAVLYPDDNDKSWLQKQKEQDMEIWRRGKR